MTIPFLSGNAAPGQIDNIFNNLRSIVNPDWQLQDAFKQFIAANPDKAQDFTDLAYSQPDVFKSLKLGKLGDKIAKAKPSAKLKINQEVSQKMDTSPIAREQAAAKAGGFKTAEENTAAQQQSELDKLRIANEKLQQTYQNLQIKHTQGQLKDADIARAADTAANDYFKSLPKGANNLYKLEKDGKLDPQIKQILFQSKVGEARYKEDANSYFKEQDDLIKQRQSGDYIHNSLWNTAERLALQIGNPDVNSVFELLKPGQMAAFTSIDNSIKSGKTREEDMISASSPVVGQMYNAFKSIKQFQSEQQKGRDLKVAGESRRLASTAMTLKGKVNTAVRYLENGTASPTDVQNAINDYNVFVQSELNIAGKDAPLLRPFDEKTRKLVYFNPSTNVEFDGSKDTPIYDIGQSSNEDKIARAVADIEKLGEAEGFKQLKAQAPDKYNTVLEAYRKKHPAALNRPSQK